MSPSPLAPCAAHCPPGRSCPASVWAVTPSVCHSRRARSCEPQQAFLDVQPCCARRRGDPSPPGRAALTQAPLTLPPRGQQLKEQKQAQATHPHSPEMKSRTLRPAKSMARAAISTDRSLTAPTMAASSLGGCKEAALRQRPSPQGSAGAAPAQLLCARQWYQLPSPARGASLAGAQPPCPPLGPGLVRDPGTTASNLHISSHL